MAKVKFWGTRGSIPAPGPKTMRYGGNTACVEYRDGDLLIIIDAGTGIRELGMSLMAEFKGRPIEGHLFVGHAHWDHIQGFPFFVPAYVMGNKFTIYSAAGMGKGFEQVLKGQMGLDYFPVTLGEMQAAVRFVELNGPQKLGDTTVTYTYLNHPGMTTGFRIQKGGKSVTYLSDYEILSLFRGKNIVTQHQDADIIKFAKGTDLLICDSMYTDEEYQKKRGWGHNTYTNVLELALQAQAKQLALFHHDPMHTDDMVDAMVNDCRVRLKERGSVMTCFAAQEGQEVTV